MQHVKLMAILVSDVDLTALLLQVNTVVKKNKMASKYTYREQELFPFQGAGALVLM